MDSLTGYVATGLDMLIVGLLLRELEPRVKVVWWSPHQFQFQLPQPPNILLTHAITIQNIGRKKAEGIEIVHTSKPSFFQLQPPLNYVESYTPQGEHIVRVDSLGQKEFFTIQFLSMLPVPQLLYIRSTAGHAQAIQTQFQRVFPKWFNLFAVSMMLIGLAFITYWILLMGIFILKGRSIRWVSLRRRKS